MRRLLWLFVAFFGGATLAAPTPIPVNRHTKASISDAEARTLLEKGSAALTVEGTNAKCGLSLTLSGSVGVFSTGNGSITSGAEYRSVCNSGGYIHVVNSIGVCGGTTADPGYTIIGCSDTPGTCEVVVRLDDSGLEQSLWMHEYGHTKGLGHRSGVDLLMNPVLRSAKQVVVSQAECDTMKGARMASLRPNASPQPQASVTEFVHQLYFEGLPLDEARKYGKGDIPALLELLRDPKEAEYWPNIVAVLGVIGDDATINPLMSFLSTPSTSFPRATYRAKLQVPVSLGYMVHERNSQKALELLEEGTDPATWTRQTIRIPEVGADAALQLLAESSILGLGASGRPKALAFLKKLDAKREFRSFSDTLKQAISSNQHIAAHGLH